MINQFFFSWNFRILLLKMAAEDKLREEAARRMERRRKEGSLVFTPHSSLPLLLLPLICRWLWSLQFYSDPGGCRPSFAEWYLSFPAVVNICGTELKYKFRFLIHWYRDAIPPPLPPDSPSKNFFKNLIAARFQRKDKFRKRMNDWLRYR